MLRLFHHVTGLGGLRFVRESLFSRELKGAMPGLEVILSGFGVVDTHVDYVRGRRAIADEHAHLNLSCL